MEGSKNCLVTDEILAKSKASTGKAKKVVLGSRKSMNQGHRSRSMWGTVRSEKSVTVSACLLSMSGTVLSTFQNQPSILTTTPGDKEFRHREVKQFPQVPQLGDSKGSHGSRAQLLTDSQSCRESCH